jgi:predicted dehydrogenase
VGLVGCGAVGRKRAAALDGDRLTVCLDVDRARAVALARQTGARAVESVDDLLREHPDAVIVATTHDALASAACRALEAGAHVLVEKPGGRSPAEIEMIAATAASASRYVQVGFNHRHHPGIARAMREAKSGAHGPVMFLRARYGHGGRTGYESEWRADPERSGGGELLDQGVHLLDLSFWLLGPLPLRGALLRTSFWDVQVEDNAVVSLGEPDPHLPWATFHVSWSEWKNEFALEIYCRRGKLQVTGLTGSYGPQSLRIFRMGPRMGPPQVQEIAYGAGDGSWAAEWRAFRGSLAGGVPTTSDTVDSARYAHACIAEAYRGCGRPGGALGAVVRTPRGGP